MTGHVFVEDAGTGLTNQEDRSWLDAASIDAAVHVGNATDYVVSELSLTPDWTVPELSVDQPFQVRVSVSDLSTRDHGGDGAATWPEATLVALVDPATLALTAGDVNEIYVSIDLASGQPDDVQLVAVDSAGSPPAEPRLKIAEADTSAETVLQANSDPDATFGDLAADSAAVESLSAAQLLADSGEVGNNHMDQFERKSSTPAIGTYSNYYSVDTAADSDFAFNGIVSVIAEDGSDNDRYSGVFWVVGVLSLTTVSEVGSETTGGTMSVNVDYNSEFSGQHTIQVKADSGSGWDAGPDSVVVTAIAWGKLIDLIDRT